MIKAKFEKWYWGGFYYAQIPYDFHQILSKKGQDRLFFHLKDDSFNRLKNYGFFCLSTCNRFEVFLGTENPEETSKELCQILLPEKANARSYLKYFEGQESFKKFLEVFLGLDSLALGESEIRGQMRRAVQKSEELNLMTPFFKRTLNDLFKTGKILLKEIEPKIIKHSFTKEIVQKIQQNPQLESTLLVGAGSMATSFLREANQAGLKNIWLTNRCTEKANELAHSFQIKNPPIQYDTFIEKIGKFNAIVMATATKTPLLKKDDVLPSHHQLKQAFDLGMPQNIDPEWSQKNQIPVESIFSLHKRPAIKKKSLDVENLLMEHLKNMMLQQMTSFEMSQNIGAIHQWFYEGVKDQLKENKVAKSIAKKSIGLLKSQLEKQTLSQKEFENLLKLSKQIDDEQKKKIFSLLIEKETCF
jgi:glutamyl-tRNA reductase